MKQYNIRNIYAQRVTKVLLFIALSKPVQHTFIQCRSSKRGTVPALKENWTLLCKTTKLDIKPTALQYNGSLNLS